MFKTFNFFHVSLMQIMIKEEDRLASVIAHIDEEVAIVPRGSYVKTPHGTVLKNRSFEGMPNRMCQYLLSHKQESTIC